MSNNPKEFKGPLYIAAAFLIIIALAIVIPYLWIMTHFLQLFMEIVGGA